MAKNGTSIFDLSLKEESSAVTTTVMSVPALRPSTTTTPTVSFFSCTSSCGALINSSGPVDLAAKVFYKT